MLFPLLYVDCNIYALNSGIKLKCKVYFQATKFGDWFSRSLDWIGESRNTGSTMSLNLLLNVWHNILVMFFA